MHLLKKKFNVCVCTAKKAQIIFFDLLLPDTVTMMQYEQQWEPGVLWCAFNQLRGHGLVEPPCKVIYL